jgi:hypothetical protein
MKRQRSGASGTIVEMKLEVDIIPVSDVEAAHDELVGRGVDASEVWHGPPFPPEAQLSGPRSGRLRWQRINRANIFLFHRSDSGRKGAEKELAVDCGRRIKPLSVPLGSTGTPRRSIEL